MLQVVEAAMEIKLCLEVKMVKSCPRDLDSNVTSPMKKILNNVKIKTAKFPELKKLSLRRVLIVIDSK